MYEIFLPSGIKIWFHAFKIWFYCSYYILKKFLFIYLLLLMVFNLLIISGIIKPGVSNWWKPIIGNSIDQSIKLVIYNWYRLVLANRWPLVNRTKIVHRLLSIGSATSNRCHRRYLFDHPPFLGGPGEIGNTNSDPLFSF